MTARIIDGTGLARRLRAEMVEDVQRLTARGRRPGLAAVLVGDDPASQSYVRSKGKACEEAGMLSRTILLPATTSESELLTLIDQLNVDPEIHGILVQLPLPKQIDTERVLLHVSPAKDVDGFHPINVGRLVLGDSKAFKPATPWGIVQMLLREGIETRGAHAVVLGRSTIVGRPLANLLMQDRPGGNATVTVCHSKTRDLPGIARTADILVAAIGRPAFVTREMVKPGAVVIDVGINRVDDASKPKGYRLTGDVDFGPVSEVASAITPVPGGVGPMTIAMVLKNTIQAAESGG
ncbi:MAG TPA: bifunctional methylenetetrahydrofolate dehydrogenase/methenyltetrahydrofolate cyclohydrolase FolD [Gemmatimonadales bacterium]|nr:bifunctional methylenetetrahydrofolate dehydrogenase/methenyltetrahydrofolate cyclohydrolase FolD [Gemmatimonadales bacterium]